MYCSIGRHILIYVIRYNQQRSSVLGNKIEMEITELVEKNSSLLRLGLHLEFNDARHRIANHLQRNIDRSKYSCFLTGTHIHHTAFDFYFSGTAKFLVCKVYL